MTVWVGTRTSNSRGSMYGRASAAHDGGKHDAQCTGSVGDREYANLFSEYSSLFACKGVGWSVSGMRGLHGGRHTDCAGVVEC